MRLTSLGTLCREELEGEDHVLHRKCGVSAGVFCQEMIPQLAIIIDVNLMNT